MSRDTNVSFCSTCTAVIERAIYEHRESEEALARMDAAPSLTSTPFFVVTDGMLRIGRIKNMPGSLGTEARADVQPTMWGRTAALDVAGISSFANMGAKLMTEREFHEARMEATDETVETFERFLSNVLDNGTLVL